MKEITLIQSIKKALMLSREGFSSSYFTVEDANGETVKIRISDHQGKKTNNGETKTISFITDDKVEGGFGYGKIAAEYLVDEDCYTDTYQAIEEVLEWSDIDFETKEYSQPK